MPATKLTELLAKHPHNDELVRLRTAILNSQGNPNVLWSRFNQDRVLMAVAMRALISSVNVLMLEPLAERIPVALEEKHKRILAKAKETFEKAVQPVINQTIRPAQEAYAKAIAPVKAALAPVPAPKPRDFAAEAKIREETKKRDAILIEASVKKLTAVIVSRAFDSFKLIDGRLLKDVRWDELPKIARDNKAQSELIERILRKAKVANPHARVRDVLSADMFDEVNAS